MRRLQPIPAGFVVVAFWSLLILRHPFDVCIAAACLCMAILFLEVGPPDFPA